MDGLSGAASVVGVVSLAVQLGDSIKKLCDFWDSVKEAPDDVHAITTDLSLLSSVLAEMAFEEQHCGPDHTLTRILEACRDRVNKLTQITNDMEPGFASTSLRIRKWTAFKAVLKGERIQKFQKVLDGLKMTLMLVQQSHHRRLNRIWYQSQRHDLTTIAKHVSSLQSEQISATVSTVTNSLSVLNDHTDALRRQASRIYRTIQNPVHRVGFEIGSNIAIQDIATNFPRDQITSSWQMANPETDHSTHSCRAETSHRSTQQISTKKVLSVRGYLKQTLFGAVTTITTTRLLRPRLVDDEPLDDEDYQFEHETSLKILPSQWLLKLGFNYAYNVSTFNSSTQGWQWCMKPINIVPDDASIFKFCDQGDIERVRDLISNNLASVRDVDSEGRTALHVSYTTLLLSDEAMSENSPDLTSINKFAVRSHSPELCKFLIEAGADKKARTFNPWSPQSPLMQIFRPSITEDRLVNAIDTYRIFEDSFDFGDEDGDGWCLLRSARYGEPTFYSWLVRSSSSDIKANYNLSRLQDIFVDGTLVNSDAVDLLLSLGSSRILGEIEQVLLGPTLFEYITIRKWNLVNTLFAWGVDPYGVHLSHLFSPIPESPLSLAMYSSWTFWGFRNALRKIYPNAEDIARQELKEGRPLLGAGWRMETLSALLKLHFEPSIELLGPSERDRCDSCRGYILGGVSVQPYWQSILESIKNGIYLQSFCSNTQEEQSSNSQSHPTISDQDSLINATDGSDLSSSCTLQVDEAAYPDQESSSSENDISSTMHDKNEVWCIRCWLHFKETGHPRSRAMRETEICAISERQTSHHDSSEDDFSPFLFNT